jgi:hypothetical protein
MPSDVSQGLRGLESFTIFRTLSIDLKRIVHVPLL